MNKVNEFEENYRIGRRVVLALVFLFLAVTKEKLLARRLSQRFIFGRNKNKNKGLVSN